MTDDIARLLLEAAGQLSGYIESTKRRDIETIGHYIIDSSHALPDKLMKAAASLKAQEEPDYWVAVVGPHVEFGMREPGPEDGGAVWCARTEVNQHINDRMLEQAELPIRLVGLYRHTPTSAVPEGSHLSWAVDSRHEQVALRLNVHRRTLDSVWRQVIKRLGGDDVALCGPRHDDLLDERGDPIAAPQPRSREVVRMSDIYGKLMHRSGTALYADDTRSLDKAAMREAADEIESLRTRLAAAEAKTTSAVPEGTVRVEVSTGTFTSMKMLTVTEIDDSHVKLPGMAADRAWEEVRRAMAAHSKEVEND